MINFSNILYSNDSINTLQVDSQARLLPSIKADSSLVVDTIAQLEQLPKVFKIPKLFNVADTVIDSAGIASRINPIEKIHAGFVGISHPIFPQSESWVFGILLLFFFILVISISSSTSLINETLRTFFQVKSRSSIFSKTTMNDFRFKYFLILFSIGVLSFYTYLIIYPTSSSEFNFQGFGIVLSITLIFFVIKAMIMRVVGYVFIDQANLKIATDSYFNILSFLGIVLFPLLIIRIYTPYNIVDFIDYASLFLVFLAYLFVIIKIVQIFFHKIVAFFYILLYLCTLEFLPLFVLFLVYKLTV